MLGLIFAIAAISAITKAILEIKFGRNIVYLEQKQNRSFLSMLLGLN